MDIASFAAAFDLTRKALALTKEVVGLLPNSIKKEAAAKAIVEAETAFKIAEAGAAKELGFMICQCTWPPQIMLLTGEPRIFNCSNCGRKVDASPAVMTAGRKGSLNKLDRF